jgi:saccharopine dehydrogenase-like NADP-dependent oxidoreductase
VSPFRVLVLGGYGHFGARIVRALARDPAIALLVGGRRPEQAAALVGETGGRASAVHVDHASRDFAARVAALAPALVVHTSGPFQGQGYHVARAAIDAGAHYADLADGRDFVCGIGALDAAARSRGVVVASGASTLPAVSGAVLDTLARPFARLERVEIVIAPGQATPRGLATLASVLSYCGAPFRAWEDGAWRVVHGWQDLRRVDLGALGTRWAARCDVPDLELLPARYPGIRTVRFDAALELALEHAGLYALAGLARARMVPAPARFAPAALALARRLDRLGSDVGGMLVRVDGVRRDGTRGSHRWELIARHGHGPEIPCLPAVVLARKLAAGVPIDPGARPCYGMMTLDDLAAAAAPFDIAWRVDERITAATPAA